MDGYESVPFLPHPGVVRCSGTPTDGYEHATLEEYGGGSIGWILKETPQYVLFQCGGPGGGTDPFKIAPAPIGSLNPAAYTANQYGRSIPYVLVDIGGGLGYVRPANQPAATDTVKPWPNCPPGTTMQPDGYTCAVNNNPLGWYDPGVGGTPIYSTGNMTQQQTTQQGDLNAKYQEPVYSAAAGASSPDSLQKFADNILGTDPLVHGVDNKTLLLAGLAIGAFLIFK